MQAAQKQATQKAQTNFQPYVSPHQTVSEMTIKAIVVGVAFALIFGAVTVYLGLKLGLTVNASIPIAVLAIMILKTLGRSTILENNIVQCIGSAGEAIAGGVIFTIPAVIFLGHNLEYWKITVFALCGGWLGVLFMIPLRRALIVKEHGVLPYPEGTACADILIAGEKRGEMAKRVFQGVGFGIGYKILMAVFLFWKEVVAWTSKKAFPGMTATVEVSPELMGIGYIIGPRSASIMVAGGVLAWMCLLPLIQFFGSVGGMVIPPGKIPIAEMSPGQIWSNYIRYIGAGAVVVGGFYNLIKSLPMIVESFAGGMRSFKASRESNDQPADTRVRTERDMPNWLLAGGSVTIVAILWMVLNFAIHPGHPFSNLVASVLIVIFGFFFVTVSCRVVGMIGTTSNPISGDTIATLMFTCLLFLLAGWTGGGYALVALAVGSVICIAAANAGTTSQDLKTGFLVGGTPKNQQIGLMLGVTTSAFIIGGTLLFMNRTYRTFTPLPAAVAIPAEFVTADTVSYESKEYRVGIVREGVPDLAAGRYVVAEDGTSLANFQEGIGGEKMPAPQARLMSLVIDGILTRKLPWGFILAGAFIAFTMILCGVQSVLAFAVGLYLPLSTTAPVFCGGMVRALVDRNRERKAKKRGEKTTEEGEAGAGSLFSSGLVAGGALGGIAVAVVANWEHVREAAEKVGPSVFGPLAGSQIFALAVFSFMGYLIYRIGSQALRTD
ncbi:MAG TPA: oligopeptide transporter, OPT family [Bdellovibrionota bacterium]|nr:oligopeptide transporter, OPT family [Bdellovibrionota bacterium]